MSQLAAFLAARQGKALADAATQGLSGARVPHVSRKGNRFSLVDAAGNEKNATFMDQASGMLFMDLIVVDVNPNKSKIYYDPSKPWSEDNTGAPLCFSDNGVAPSTQATTPQNSVCASCPQNDWGSATSRMTGEATRACRDQKKLAVVVPGDESGIVYEFIVPPASFSDKEHGWVRYVKSITGHMIGDQKADVCDVVTRVYFVPGKMGILGFQPAAGYNLVMQDEGLAGLVMHAWENDSSACKAVTGILDKPRDPNAPVAPRPVAQAAPAPALPAPPVQPTPLAPVGSVAAPMVAPSAAPAAEAPKGRGRPRKTGEAAPVAATPFPSNAAPAAAPTLQPAPVAPVAPAAASISSPSDDVIPSFLKRNPAPAVAPAPAAVIAGVATNPPAPPSDMQAALDAAFNLLIPGAP